MDEVDLGIMHSHKIEYGEGKIKRINVGHCCKCAAHILIPAKYDEKNYDPYACVECGGEDLSKYEDELEKEAHVIAIDRGPKYCSLRNKVLVKETYKEACKTNENIKKILDNWLD